MRGTDTGYYLSCQQFVPLVEQEREAQGLSKRELEDRIGFGSSRWSHITQQAYISERVADKVLVGLGCADWWYTKNFQFYRFGAVPNPYREEHG